MINSKQDIIINKAKTPAAVIAGPGTGKTFTIVKKVLSLIKNEGLDPDRILITTFTKRAASELSTRIISELKAEGLKLSLKDLKIGNFHSLALDFLEKYPRLDESFLKSRVIDANFETYFIEKNLEEYKKIPSYKDFIGYNDANMIKSIYEEITNNLLKLEELKESKDLRENFAYEVYKKHESLLKDYGLINFQMILRDFYELLSHKTYGGEIRESIDFVIVDEYQDTNYIQQEIAFKLVKDKDIMVFGDDDQALYSFRGADPRNLTDFSEKFYKAKGHKANYYRLDINYRSDEHIIKKSREFLQAGPFENKKSLRSVKRDENPNTMVRARSYQYKNLAAIIKHLSGSINLGQIAFLFPSVNHSYVKKLSDYLERSGIRVLNKRSGMFFERDEIRSLVYVLLKATGLKPIYEDVDHIYGWENKKRQEFDNYLYQILNDKSLIEDRQLEDFISCLDLDLPITKNIYRSIGLERFRAYLIMDERDLLGLRTLTNIKTFIAKAKDFDEVFASKGASHYEDFISGFLYHLYKTRAINELEDIDTHEDAVNIMTIHQAKGLEFEVVFISGLYDKPRRNKPGFLLGESQSDLSFLRDFYRKYYTGFTRARRLLVLLDNSKDIRLKDFSRSLPPDSKLSTIDFSKSSPKKEKKTLAYTTDIEVFMACPLKYRFVRRLGFMDLATRATDFGSGVHKLIGYLSLRPEELDRVRDFIKDKESFKGPIKNFLKRDFDVVDVEANYKLDRGFYILQGNVDLGLAGGSIVDIKTGKFNEDLLKKYQGQLQTYRLLIEKNGGRVAKTYLYYVEEDRLLEVGDEGLDTAMIDKVARLIDKDLYFKRTDDKKECRFCQMKYFCKRD